MHTLLSKTYLQAMVTGYIACALWSSNDESTEDGGEPMDQNYGPDDITPESRVKMFEDCANFLTTAFSTLSDLEADISYDTLPPEQVGHDFWLTRNGHGAGFWDRCLDHYGDTLTDMCVPYGESDLYVGDDKKLHIN